MSTEQTADTMDRYFRAMGTGSFADHFTDDVTWTTIESGEIVRGPIAVQDAIIALHSRMRNLRTRQLLIGDHAAFIEGDADSPDPHRSRICYGVAYDLDGNRIAAMRAYGPLAKLMPTTSERSAAR